MRLASKHLLPVLAFGAMAVSIHCGGKDGYTVDESVYYAKVTIVSGNGQSTAVNTAFP